MIPSSKTCSFDKLQKQNPVQSQNVWKALQVGIENLLNKKLVTPNVYLFLYQDRQKLQKLTQDIAVETARCFGNQEVIEMQRKDFITQEGDDYGYAIEMYKQKIKKGKVLVIIHLNELPANAARALHTICETVNPIADGVVIFLTLNTWKQVNSNSNSVQLAVDTLQELWGKQLGSNELDPLITRVTDQLCGGLCFWCGHLAEHLYTKHLTGHFHANHLHPNHLYSNHLYTNHLNTKHIDTNHIHSFHRSSSK
ncbi:uncharacterized protein TORIP [Drosophila tropicalis]|uniref:uncharacterized protein TORIP n=1 Tax=Drosophila tropicalis TaxID=46794 RepID=UPI0035ABE31E